MVSTFQNDLEEGRKAEQLTCSILSDFFYQYDFRNVGDIPAFYHKGDIEALDKTTNSLFYIEVKNDSRLAETQNVLCEEAVYYKRENQEVRGNMYSNYEIYCVLSESEHKLYIIDFARLRSLYRFGKYCEINHQEQITYCYLVPIKLLWARGGIIGVLDYKRNIYYSQDIENINLLKKEA